MCYFNVVALLILMIYRIRGALDVFAGLYPPAYRNQPDRTLQSKGFRAPLVSVAESALAHPH